MFADLHIYLGVALAGLVSFLSPCVLPLVPPYLGYIGGTTFDQWSRPEVIVARYQGLLRYFRKHHPRREVRTLRTAIAALAIIRALPLAFVDRSRARAYAEVVRLTLDAS